MSGVMLARTGILPITADTLCILHTVTYRNVIINGSYFRKNSVWLSECEMCGGGGAIGAVNPGSLRITNCTLDGNAAPAGGAVFLRQAPKTLVDQVTANNRN